MKLFALLLLSVLITADAKAQNTMDLGRFSFDLDVPPGNSSSWTDEGIRGVTSLTAEIAVLELRRHDRFAPLFGLHLIGNGGSREGGRVALMLTPTSNRRALQAYIAVDEPGAEEARRLDFPGTFALDDTLSVQMDWSQEGNVSIAINGTSARLSAAWLHPVHLRASASTGQMKAYRLVLRGIREL